MKKLIFWLCAAVLVVTLFRMPRMVEDSIPSIYYVSPKQTTYERTVSCTGTVQPAAIREVYLQQAAYPQDVAVEAGDRVEQGQLLLRLTPVDLEAGAGETLASLSRLAQAQTSPLDAIGALDLAAVAALYSISDTLSGGAADYSELTELLALVQEQQISQVSGEVVEPRQSAIYAPAAGIVTAISARENVPALPGVALLSIADDSGYKVLASVAEADIAKVEPGNAAKVRCTGNNSRVYHGTVTKISPTAHKVLRGTSTETVVDVEIELLDPDGSLKPGFTAKVEILGGQDFQMVTVPYEAIRQDENNNEYVYIYRDGKIVKTPVITGQELTSVVEIVSGLEMEDIVVYNPSDIVREGTMVNLKGRADVD